MSSEGKCPVTGGHDDYDDNAVVLEMSNHAWWPNQLNVKVLHQNSALSDPLGAAFRSSKALTWMPYAKTSMR